MNLETIDRATAAIDFLSDLFTGDLVFIKHGNHWLQCTPQGELARWTTDLGSATLLSRDVAGRLVEDAAAARRHFDMLRPLEAFGSSQRSAASEVKSRWLIEFEDRVRASWPNAKLTKEGILVNAHMHVGHGRTIEQALRQFRVDLKLPEPSKKAARK